VTPLRCTNAVPLGPRISWRIEIQVQNGRLFCVCAFRVLTMLTASWNFYSESRRCWNWVTAVELVEDSRLSCDVDPSLIHRVVTAADHDLANGWTMASMSLMRGLEAESQMGSKGRQLYTWCRKLLIHLYIKEGPKVPKVKDLNEMTQLKWHKVT